MDKLKIIYFGTPQFSAFVLKRLLQLHPGSVVAVVTNPDKPAGRKQVMTRSAVAEVADEYQIPVFRPEGLEKADTIYSLSSLKPDFFLVISFGKKIPENLLKIPHLGAINIHASLLPKYRGASPIQQAILNGDRETGLCAILMDEKIDHGPILAVERIKISSNDTYESLSKLMADAAAPFFLKTIGDLTAGKIQPKRQVEKEACFCGQISKDDGFFEIQNPPPQLMLDRMIRAYHPWPGVWTKWNGKIVKFSPGQMVQMEGKRAVPFLQFMRGYPDFPFRPPASPLR